MLLHLATRSSMHRASRHKFHAAGPLGPIVAIGLCLLAAGALLATPTWAANHTVEARPNNTFSPSNLTIEVGDSVTFVNAGGFHNVEANDGSFRCRRRL